MVAKKGPKANGEQKLGALSVLSRSLEGIDYGGYGENESEGEANAPQRNSFKPESSQSPTLRLHQTLAFGRYHSPAMTLSDP